MASSTNKDFWLSCGHHLLDRDAGGSLIAAKKETISGKSDMPVSPLVSMLGIPAEAEIDVMNDDNAKHYFEHSDRFHVAFDLTGGRRGLQALSSVIARWVGHLLGVE